VIPKLDGFNVNSPKVFGLYCTKASFGEIEVIGHDPPVYPLHPVNPPDTDDLAIVLESSIYAPSLIVNEADCIGVPKTPVPSPLRIKTISLHRLAILGFAVNVITPVSLL
jgi:hypothetical protein